MRERHVVLPDSDGQAVPPESPGFTRPALGYLEPFTTLCTIIATATPITRRRATTHTRFASLDELPSPLSRPRPEVTRMSPRTMRQRTTGIPIIIARARVTTAATMGAARYRL